MVVTGASSGVGRAIAREFGKAGAKVGLIARTREALENAADEIRAVGSEAIPLPLDVSDAQAVERAADEVVARFGRIDTWVNDAMVSVFSKALEMKPEEYKRVMEVNFLGYVHGTLAAVRRMEKRGGVVIQIGSALAYRSIPLQSAYCSSKAAIRGFTDALRTEFLHNKVPVQLCQLELPAVNTPQFDVVRSRLPKKPQPVPPIYQPEVIARMAVYAAEHPRREIYLGQSSILAIASRKYWAWLSDRLAAKKAYESQMTEEPADPLRSDDVFLPLPGDRGAHGRFDGQARAHNAEMWMDRHRALVAGAALSAFALGRWGVRRALAAR